MKIPAYLYLYFLLFPILYEKFIVNGGNISNPVNFKEFDRFILNAAYNFFCGHQGYCDDSAISEKNVEDFATLEKNVEDLTILENNEEDFPNGSIYFDYNNTNYYDDFKIPRKPQSDCERCSCDASTCTEPFLFLTCCPSIVKNLEEHVHKEGCNNPLLSPWAQNSSIGLVEAIIMIDKCPEHENILPEYKDKCEQSRTYADFNIQNPVSVKGKNEIVYKNIYCAYCNRLTDLDVVNWYPNVECYFGVKLDVSATLEQVIDLVKTNKNCRLIFIPPSTEQPKRLKSCGHFISECNVTGQWKYYDKLTDLACRSFSLPYRSTYRNVFCYLCNINSSNGYIKSSELIKNAMVTSFSLVLKFMPSLDEMRESKSGPQCEHFGVYDFYQGKCLPVRCLFHQSLVAGECKRNVEGIYGLECIVILKAKLLQPVGLKNNLKLALTDFVVHKLSVLGLSRYMKVLKIYQAKSSNVAFSPKEYDFIIFMSFQVSSIRRNVFVNTAAIEWILQQHNYNLTISDRHGVEYSMVFELDTIDALGDNFELFQTYSHIPALLPVYSCPSVELDASFYHFNFDEETVSIKELKAVIKRNEYIKTEHSSILVCRDKFESYLKKQNKSSSKQIKFLETTTQGIVSVVCTSCSILCSVISLLAFVRVKNMRTQPGINNFCLILSLVNAQTFFQFSAGQANNIPMWACGLLGGISHYSWMVTILWMNVCTFHMYKQFHKLQILTYLKASKRTTCLYWTYCLFIASIPVLINILAKYLNEKEFGYGGTLCYITDYLMVGFCFALPVAIIILVNISLFIATVLNICRRPSLRRDRKEEIKFLVVYTKMSTVTGLTWAFGFLYAFTNFHFFEYLFIILNASQGVFLFISFVCNRRVLRSFLRPEIMVNSTKVT